MKKKVTISSCIFLHSSIKTGLRLQELKYDISLYLGLIILNTKLKQTFALSSEGHLLRCMWNNTISIFCGKCRTEMQSNALKRPSWRASSMSAWQQKAVKVAWEPSAHKYPRKRWQSGQTNTKRFLLQLVYCEQGLINRVMMCSAAKGRSLKPFVSWLRASNGSFKAK